VKTTGDPRRVVGAYITAVEKGEEQQLAAAASRAREAAEAAAEPATAVPQHPVETAEAPEDMFRATEGRWGSREVEITDVAFLGEDGEPGHVFHSGERVAVRLNVRANRPVDDFVFGFGLFSADGVCCYGTNTDIENYVSERFAGEGIVWFTIDSLDLTEGTYRVDVAVHKRDGVPYDYHRLLYTFRVKSTTKDVGLYRPRHRWSFSQGMRIRLSTK